MRSKLFKTLGSLESPKVAKLLSRMLRVLRKFSEAQEMVASLSSHRMLRVLRKTQALAQLSTQVSVKFVIAKLLSQTLRGVR
jgi:hypothetical protein